MQEALDISEFGKGTLVAVIVYGVIALVFLGEILLENHHVRRPKDFWLYLGMALALLWPVLLLTSILHGLYKLARRR